MYINKLFRGRYFQIEYIIEKKKYFIKDLWIGYGSFLKFDFPVTLKDNHLINIGESYLIANIINLDKEKNDINDDNIRLKIKVFKYYEIIYNSLIVESKRMLHLRNFKHRFLLCSIYFFSKGIVKNL